MKWNLKNQILIEFALALALLIAISLASYRSLKAQIETARSVTHTQAVSIALEKYFSSLKDVVVGQRGYLLTGQETYLDPYDQGRAEVPRQLENLRQLTADNPAQRERLNELEKFTQERLALVAERIETRRTRGFDAALDQVLAERLMIPTNKIRNLVSAMLAAENESLAVRLAAEQKNARIATTLIPIGSLLALAIVAFSIGAINRELKRRRLAEQTLQLANESLERRVAERTADVQRAAESLRVTLGSIGDAVIATDTRGKITFMNEVAEKLTGWRQSETVGLDLLEIFKIVDEKNLQVVESPIAQVIRDGAVIKPTDRLTLLSKDGRQIPIDNSGAPIKDAAGAIIGAVMVFRDVTDRRAAENEREEFIQREHSLRLHAESASRFKDEFLALVSHELRSPLNAINGYAHLLGLNNLQDDEARHAIETIQRSAKAQAHLIDDLLDTSRIITGKLRLSITRANLQQVIDAALDTVRPAAAAKEIEIVTELDREVPEIAGDPARLQQVIWNLLSNAVKFTPKGGRVNLRLQLTDSQVCIVVSDTGKGISPDFLPYVFDRFRQQDGSFQRAHGGMGLGLAIVRHLVEMHGGSVVAESPGDGRGSTFTITFPIKAAPREPAEIERASVAPQDQNEAARSRLNGLRVLVVDDEEDVRAILTSLLAKSGIEVKACGSAQEALEELSRSQPDLLISDISMPQIDGYVFLQQVRALPSAQGGNVPAIALTAFARGEDRIRALAAGYQAHVSKPVEPAELRAVIASLANRM